MILSAPVAWLVNSPPLSHDISDNAIFQQAVMHRQCFATSLWAVAPAADIWSDNMVVNNISGFKDKKKKRIESWKLLVKCSLCISCPYLSFTGKRFICSLSWSGLKSHTGQGWQSFGCFFSVCVYCSYRSALLDSVHFPLSTNAHRPPSRSPRQC